jgi:hypothetical protein
MYHTHDCQVHQPSTSTAFEVELERNDGDETTTAANGAENFNQSDDDLDDENDDDGSANFQVSHAFLFHSRVRNW